MTNEKRNIGENSYQISLGTGLRKVERDEGESFDALALALLGRRRVKTPATRFRFTNRSLVREKVCRCTVTPIAKSSTCSPDISTFLQVTGAGEEWITCAGGETIIIPINTLHAFYNRTEEPARLLSISTQLHQAFFDAVAETNRAHRFASMTVKQAMERIAELARQFEDALF
jgi:hypothetical protein